MSTWHCIHRYPCVLHLGQFDKGMVTDAKAYVVQRPDDTWGWGLMARIGPKQPYGDEPTGWDAMRAAKHELHGKKGSAMNKHAPRPIPEALYSCKYCAEELSWPASDLWWSEVDQAWVCDHCWGEREDWKGGKDYTGEKPGPSLAEEIKAQAKPTEWTEEHDRLLG